MALSVTGLDANGRVTPKGTNVIIPPEGAGIGDCIYKSGSTVKVIGRGTGSAASITIGGSTYTLYGVIYGFVNGYAMVVAPSEASKAWAASGVSAPSGAPIYGGGTALMRNGLRATYAQMNTARNSGYITGGSSAPVTLSSAYQATSLSSSSTWSSVSADIRNKYGSWTEYIRQTLRVNGAPGSPFGAAVPASNVKVHEFGRWMTSLLNNSTNYPAGYYCWNYSSTPGEWWLPSMFELGELMIDEHLNLVNQNTNGFTAVSAASYRWSCVCNSSSVAWHYGYTGMSNNSGFTYTLTARPVTLLKLV